MNLEIRSRIGAARLLLQSLEGESRASASRTQSAALLATFNLQQNAVRVEERAALHGAGGGH